jgi:hypothetical protein
MPIPYENTARYRWLNKPVLESRLLDNMEDLATWKIENRGEGRGEIALTAERARDGTHSLRLRSRTMGEKPGSVLGRPPGTAGAVRVVNGEDWNHWNRLSFWVYPDLPGFHTVSLLVLLTNYDIPPDPNGWNWPNRGDFVLLKNQEWNHVVSEFTHVARDKIVGVELQYRLQGNEPGATNVVTFDFDRLELQRVEPDYFEGWSVWPGRVSYSHTGYQTGAPKTAIAGEFQAREFEIIRQETGQAVMRKPVETVKSPIGQFQALDFSELRQPGAYAIRIGDTLTRPFRVEDNVWRETIWKAINFFYCERCGCAVPGIHDVCHRDWQGVHGDKRIVINGGWHDAGDLSQGLENTSQTVYYMFGLAEKLRARGDQELAERLIEEAKWGLDWVLKTTFHDGYRVSWATMDFWTDGILGDVDDVTSGARNGSYENFLAAAAEGIAYRVLRDSDPELAAHGLQTAREDWQYAVGGMSSSQRRSGQVQVASAGILASLELYRATGEKQYAAKAVELAAMVTGSQQRSFLAGLDVPLTGFFYTGPDKTRVLRSSSIDSQQQLPMAAMRALCDALPDHEDWIKWYSAAALHAEYLKATARYAEPYGMLPASLYRDDEYLQIPEDRREFLRTQVLKGIKIGDHYYLRMFPAWSKDDTRGNLGVLLSAAKAASEAAGLRGDLQGAELAERQLEWTVGRNPFSMSLMYGEGYDFCQFSAMSGNMVGSLMVGIQTRFDRDVPYSPAANWPNWREVWVLTANRWLALMQDLAGPALVQGYVAAGPSEPVQFRDTRNGYAFTVQPDYGSGAFRAEIPEGEYEVSAGSLKKRLTALPARSYNLDLRPESFLDWEVSSEADAQGNVTITVTARGAGSHAFALRTDNLNVSQPNRTVNLRAGAATKIAWQGKLASNDGPWVAVVAPDGRMDQRQEAYGAIRR